MLKVLTFIHSLTPFTAENWELLQPALSKKVFKKNEFLLKEEEVCNSLFYIESGSCKSYYEIDGEIKNTFFYFEDEIATNLSSFGSGQKSNFNIIATEPLTAIIFDKEKLFDIAKHSLAIEALGRCCIRLYAIKQEELSTVFQLYSTEERLAYLERTKPELLKRVPLSQLASFLGVKRETLSRIRKRRIM